MGVFNLGALYGIGSGICLAIVMVAIRLLSYSERTHMVLFYYFLFGWVGSLPLLIYYWTPMGAVEWAEIIGLGVSSFLGQWALIRAFHHAKPSQIGPFCYMAVVYSALFQWAIWGNFPDWISWIGIALVSLGGILTIWFGREKISQPS